MLAAKWIDEYLKRGRELYPAYQWRQTFNWYFKTWTYRDVDGTRFFSQHHWDDNEFVVLNELEPDQVDQWMRINLLDAVMTVEDQVDQKAEELAGRQEYDG